MTANTFWIFDVNDDNPAVTLEKVFEHFGSYAGVHHYQFDSAFQGFSTSDLTCPPGYGVDSAGSLCDQTGGDYSTYPGGIAWHSGINSFSGVGMPNSYMIEFTALTPDWSIFVYADELPGTGSYKIRYLASDPTQDYFNGNYIEIDLLGRWSFPVQIGQKSLPKIQANAYSRVKVMVRNYVKTSDSIERLIYISVWIDDVLILSVSDEIARPIGISRLGFWAQPQTTSGVDHALITNFRLANLSEVVPWSSLDPGEHPLDGIRRTIEDRYIKFHARWNGSIRAWRPHPVYPVDQTLVQEREFHLAPIIDTRGVFTHLRMLGAFQWVQTVDKPLLELYGHSFHEMNNTALWDISDCYNESFENFKRAKEQISQVQYSTFGYVYLEAEDHVNIPDLANAGQYIEYLIDTVTWQYTHGTFKLDITARKAYNQLATFG